MRKWYGGLFPILFLLFLFFLPTQRCLASVTSLTDTSNGTTVSQIAVIGSNETSVLDHGQQYEAILTNETGFRVEDVIPISINTAGTLELTILNKATRSAVPAALYSDADCTNRLADFTSYKTQYYLNTPTTYYLKIQESTIENTLTIDFKAKLISNVDLDAQFDKLYPIASDSNNPSFVHVIIPQDGILTIDYDGFYGGYVQLCDESKVPVTNLVYLNSSCDETKQTIFGVSKGSYYLKLQSNSLLCHITLHTNKIIDRSGAKKVKAATLKTNKKMNGILTTSDKSGKIDWFKIILKKNSTLKLQFTGNVNSDEFRVEITSAKLKNKITFDMSGLDYSNTIRLPYQIDQTLKKGTYYVKIIKNTSQTSGNYTVKRIH
ncbi:hypothetical protein lbkm_1128 [Lachnospiraceae bacterium KM106-2]|nr:hypothetical protein lbkm_1128 [Lachnospiraceae bacterium KM106-2]